MRILLFFVVMLIANPAFAVDLFTPAPNDKAMYVLSQIFGDLGVFGSGNDAIASGMEIFWVGF